VGEENLKTIFHPKLLEHPIFVTQRVKLGWLLADVSGVGYVESKLARQNPIALASLGFV